MEDRQLKIILDMLRGEGLAPEAMSDLEINNTIAGLCWLRRHRGEEQERMEGSKNGHF